MSKSIAELKSDLALISIESRQIGGKAVMSPADKKRVDELHKEYNSIKDEITAQEIRSQRPPRSQPGVSNDERFELEKRAMRDFVIHGKVSENRDLGVSTPSGSITGGSQLVAPAFSPILTQAQLAYGGVVNIVNQRQTETGASMKVSLVNDTANGLTTWGEDTAATETDPVLSTITSNTDKYTTGAILVTIEELQDSYFDLDAFIRDAFGQRLYRGLAKNISQGSGSFGSYFAGATSGATSAGPTAVTYADLLALYGSLDPAYLPNATWTMNAATRTALLGVVDTTGRPLFQPALSAPNGADALGTLLGHPVVLDQYAPNIAATNKPIAFGDFKSGYTLRNVGEFSIARDPYTYLISKGAVGFIGYGRGGSYSTDAGTHPIKYLTMHA
ncbi:MAG TPA: phage major capsid protein [Edaphobacter sp.]|nr:phage major capsid protein [Edaphobacter sp.]